MISFCRRHFLFLAGSLPGAPLLAQLIGNRSGGWSIRGTNPVEIYFGDEPVSAYHAGYEEGMPFFDPVAGPSGEPYTGAIGPKEGESVGPRGVWFALGNVNGHDFGARPDPARKRGVILHRGMNGVMIKGAALMIRTKSEWMETTGEQRRLCSDRREFTFFHREDGSLVLEAAIELMADAGDLEIGPCTSGAWSVLPAPGFVWKEGEKARGLVESGGRSGGEVEGTRSSWVACQGLDGRGIPGGVAILGHPDNPGHPARWHVGDEGGISADPFPEETPVVLPNGQSLSFRYRTIFHSGSTDGAAIPAAFEAFAAK